MQKLYLGTNTKMYKTIADTVSFLTKLSENTADLSRENLELFVIPSYTTLKDARQCVSKESITIGAQTMGWEDQGQFTGSKSHDHSSPGFRRNRIAAAAITNTIRPTGRIPTIHSTAVGT